MPSKDLHKEPFDEKTITKLDIFEKYIQAWIPVFVMSRWSPILCIFDFFAGTGKDLSGIEGSPLRILSQISLYTENIISENKNIQVFLNEKDSRKYDQLMTICQEYIATSKSLQKLRKEKKLEIKFSNEDFDEIFPKYIKKLEKNPSLVLLDQNGVRFLGKKYFIPLTACKQVDFLYFVSSSYFNRFNDRPEFQTALSVSKNRIKEKPYKYIHEIVIEELRKEIPKNSSVRLYPFSIKKNSNIYGLIFGASHILAVDKFLEISWKKNNINGAANFDIDDDTIKGMLLDLFGNIEYTKIQKFQMDLEMKILKGELKNNKSVYKYTLSCGHIPNHAVEVIKKLRENKRIDYEGKSPLVNYNQIYKHNKLLSYQIINKG